jgi:hypothetical protein
MAISLVEASKLSNDVLLQGIIETIIKDSPILQEMPFIQIVGNGLTYNKETALPSINSYDVGDTWVESTPTFTQVTATLKIMGGDADVDNFLKSTRSNIQDLETAIIEQKAKALRHEFEKQFLYGDAPLDANAKEFDGIIKLIDTGAASDQLIAAGASGATLTLSMIDQLIDAVKGGKPNMLLMSRRSRRKIQNLARAAGSNLEVGQGKLGDFVQLYNGIPIAISDWILDVHALTSSLESAYSGGACSTIYAFQLGEGALCGLSSPEMLQVERLGSLETKDATRTRVKWYVSLALFSQVKAAALIGVKD